MHLILCAFIRLSRTWDLNTLAIVAVRYLFNHHHHQKTPGLSATKSESSIPNRTYDLSNFAVVTVIFNPIKYKSRYNHYEKFREHMSKSRVNLYTVECLFESAQDFGLPSQQFEITQGTNPHHIQLIAPSIIWMKENLINIAIRRLPENIEYVAWIDADIEFENLSWPHRTIEELKRYPIVQLFELSFFLGPGGKSDILRRDYSFGYSIRHNKPINPRNYDDWYAHPGYAWAMRRSALKVIGGLLDFCIVGSGDLHFAFALLHRIEETFPPGLHSDYQQLALTWGDRLAQLAQNGANVGYVPVNLYHHWHGERNDRHYVDRWAILKNHQFSPTTDLEKNHENGLIRLADKRYSGNPEAAKRMEALERAIIDYFRSRNEDKSTKSTPKQPPNPPKNKPNMPAQPKPYKSTGLKYPNISTSKGGGGGGNRRPIWSSGPAGTHVDDHNPDLHHCICPGHHHHHDNHDCPCSPNHMDDQHCWNPSENDHHDHHHHHHHDKYPDTCYPVDDYHHHQHETDHHSGGHHFSHEHQPQGCWDLGDNSGHDHGHSSGGGGHDHTDYGGHDHGHSSGGGGHDHTDYGGHGSFY